MQYVCSSLDPLHIRRLLPIALGTLPLALAVFVPQEAGPVADDGRGEVERAGKHVAVGPGSAKSPVRVKGGRGREEAVGHEARGERRDGRLDAVATAV